MSAALMPTTPPMPTLHWPSRTWSRHALAISIAAGLHALVVLGLVSHWQASTPPEPPIQTLTTQLITLAPPQPPAPQPVVAAPVPVQPEVVAAPPKPVERKPLETKPKAPPKPTIDHAALARKRVQEQEQQAAELQRVEQQRVEQQRIEQQRQQVAAQEQAAAKARAAAEQLAADSRQYQPISKEAPEYPQKALDKGIEGDCTVTYTVTPQGRVENPQVLGECHPLLVRPSLAAARTFRYQPRIVDGQAIAVANVKNTFHYRIQ